MNKTIDILYKPILPILFSAALFLMAAPKYDALADTVPGDLTNDGWCDENDVALIKIFLLCNESYADDMTAADYDESGSIDFLDYILMLRKACINGNPHETTTPEPETTTDKETTTVSETTPMWILEPKGALHYGEGTYYGGGYTGGCASFDTVSSDYLVAAMNLADYNNAMLAGAYIELTGPKGTVELLITDLLPEGAKGDVDLNIDAFPYIARLIDGRVDVSWKIIPLPTDEPVSWKFKNGSTQFWCGVQVRNHRYPVAKLEYLNKSGEFTELERKQYNYFVSDDMGAGPFTFRVTDIYGDVFVEKDIPMQLGEPFPGKGQFPE